MLIDDEPDLLFLLDKVLTERGFHVLGTAADGEAGIELVRAQQPEVAVLDLAMPKLDGEQALPTLVREAPTTMVAVCSAHVDIRGLEHLLSRGAFAAYPKSDLHHLPDRLLEDLRRFRSVLDGHDNVPGWVHST